MVAVLVSVYFTFRILDRTDLVDGLAAGLAAGVAISIKPSNSVFLLGPILALAYRKRLRGAAYMAVGLAPAVITLTLWKYRGLGTLPLFQSQGDIRLALGAGGGLVAFNPLHRYVQFDWGALHTNLLGIKEHFWSMRVVEWLVLAGLIGVARRSLTAFLLIGGWFAAFVVTKGAWGGANINGGSVFRIMMPSFPAFVLMLASLVFLWPRGRKGRRPRPALPEPRSSLRPRTRLALVGAAALVFAVSPLVVVAAVQPLHGPNPRAYEVDVLLRPIDPALKLTALRVGDRVRLSWNGSQPSQAKVFYRIWRSGSPNGGAACTPVPGGSDNCTLTMADVGAHPGGSWVDRPGTGRWTYRLALEANWLDLPSYGDVFTVGPPVTVRVP
jgi:hypothetical protein